MEEITRVVNLQSELFSDVDTDNTGGDVSGFTPDGVCRVLAVVIRDKEGVLQLQMNRIRDHDGSWCVDLDEFMSHLAGIIESLSY